jgi:hypothetical protein
MEWTHGNSLIVLDAESKLFVVFYDSETEGRMYSSYEEATDAIDARKERYERNNRVKINVPVVSQSGQRYVITGIHSGHGRYISKPPLATYTGSVYLDHQLVNALISNLKKARDYVLELEKRLNPFELSTSDYQRKLLGLTTTDGIEAWRVTVTRKADEAIVIRAGDE